MAKRKPATRTRKSLRPAKRPATGDEAGIFQIKITLLDSEPKIWRRIQVTECTLAKLHEYIQTAMGWTNSHLHQFRIGQEYCGDPQLLGAELEPFIDSTRTMLSDIVPKDGKRFRFLYEYDFGDGWMHELIVEKRLPLDPEQDYPICLEGENACPPEDIGGVWGYVQLQEALAGKKSPRHQELLEWFENEDFDPTAFDAAGATKAMHAGLGSW